MCTVTLIPVGETVRLACNRDEQRSRPAALPPRVRRFGQRWAVLPVDPISGGTWIAVNDAGLAMTLLNVNPSRQEGKVARRQSRGRIIPSLLHCDTLPLAVSQALSLDAKTHAPFRLVVADREQWAELRFDGEEARLRGPMPFTAPLLFTSSGLGDHLVEELRRQLFLELFHQPLDLVERQELFHQHCWPERPHLSVCMSRQDARTVSHTIVTPGPDAATLTYYPDGPAPSAECISVSLPLAAGVVA